MNYKNAFLKKSETFRTPYTFVKIVPLNYSGREGRVLKKSMFDIEPRNLVNIISCSICCPSGGHHISSILVWVAPKIFRTNVVNTWPALTPE